MRTETNHLTILNIRWKGKIKINHRGIKYEDLKQTKISQGRVLFRAFVNTIMNLGVAGKQ